MVVLLENVIALLSTKVECRAPSGIYRTGQLSNNSYYSVALSDSKNSDTGLDSFLTEGSSEARISVALGDSSALQRGVGGAGRPRVNLVFPRVHCFCQAQRARVVLAAVRPNSPLQDEGK